MFVSVLRPWPADFFLKGYHAASRVEKIRATIHRLGRFVK